MSRTDFEAAYIERYGHRPRGWNDDFQVYQDAHANGAWFGWQARAAGIEAKAAPVGEREAFMELWSQGKFEPAFMEDFELCLQCFKAGAAHQRQQAREVVMPDIKELVNRFLSWPLPESLCSDPCASMPGYPHRTGTNLMTAEQAMAMFGHVLAHLKDKEVFDGH